ncbi:hypothetical protein [Bacillus swezeyi]|uniref:hypothetical protein n=1 Tax=Bacillus swezeyi TaxID=1925020 RepID=UPI001680A4D3|nr:hypothetical protein [Bacillus swezeyi]
MNTSLATFMKIGVTAVTIGILLFTVGYGIVKGASTSYGTSITSQTSKLPTE